MEVFDLNEFFGRFGIKTVIAAVISAAICEIAARIFGKKLPFAVKTSLPIAMATVISAVISFTAGENVFSPGEIIAAGCLSGTLSSVVSALVLHVKSGRGSVSTEVRAYLTGKLKGFIPDEDLAEAAERLETLLSADGANELVIDEATKIILSYIDKTFPLTEDEAKILAESVKTGVETLKER